MENNTLIRHAEAFATAVCNNIRDMVGVELSTSSESLAEVRFLPSRAMTVMIHFTGAIQGEFAVSLDETYAAALIGAWSEGMPDDELCAMRGDYGGFLKELLNTSVGQVIPGLESEFDALTFLPPVVVWGSLEYPDVPAGFMSASSDGGEIQCYFVLNMMGLELGERLQAAIQQLRSSVQEASAAKRSVASMLEAFPQGLVTVDRSGVVRPGHARCTAQVVGLRDPELAPGQHLVDLLGYEESLRRDMGLWLEIVHDRHGIMPFRDLLGLCPITEMENTRGNLLKLEWVPLLGESGALDGLLLMIEDVTEKRRVENEMRKLSKLHEEGVELMTQIVNLEPDEIQDFVFDSSGLLDQARQIVQGAHRDRQFIEGLYRTVHTLKGNSGQFQFKGLQSLAMEIETNISRLRDEAVLEDSESQAGIEVGRISQGLEEAEAYIKRLEDLRGKLGRSNESVQEKAQRNIPTVMVPIDQIDLLASTLWGIRETGRSHNWSPVVVNAVGQSAVMAAHMREVDLGRLAPTLQQVVDRVSARLRKKARFSLISSINIDVDVMRDIHRCLVHLLNNALDHGLESPDQRLASGKLETGLVTLEARRETDSVVIVFTDDGRGIDYSGLRRTIVARGLVEESAIDSLSDADVSSFLFKSGFSTRGEVTEFSGRGVGLDMVRATIDDLEGSVAIEALPGKGTRFIMRIPLEVAQPSQRYLSQEVSA